VSIRHSPEIWLKQLREIYDEVIKEGKN